MGNEHLKDVPLLVIVNKIDMGAPPLEQIK
jgi:hypothetical protein